MYNVSVILLKKKYYYWWYHYKLHRIKWR